MKRIKLTLEILPQTNNFHCIMIENEVNFIPNELLSVLHLLLINKYHQHLYKQGNSTIQ